jgi:predicted RNA-binding Zn-ribbon protein involved in translation (DUF1610 family)
MADRKRAYVTGEKTAEFVCPTCGETGAVPLAERIRTSTPVRMRYRCRCGAAHVIYVEKRISGRKAVSIPGRFIAGNGEASMTIRNLSRHGLMFDVDEQTEVEVGQRVVVRFDLTTVDTTHVEKDVTVRWTSDHSVGGEFSSGEYDRFYDIALAQYPGTLL